MEKEKKFQARISKEGIVLFTVLLAVFAAAGIFLLAAAKEPEYPYDVRSDRRFMNLKDVELIERAEDGNGMCMVYIDQRNGIESPLLVSDQYIVQYKIVPSDGVNKENIIIYNIEKDTENIITYEDYEAALPEYIKNSYVTGSVVFFQDQGKWCMAMEFWMTETEKIPEEITSWPWMVIELDSGEITDFVTMQYVDEITRESEVDQEYNRILDIFRRSAILGNFGSSFMPWEGTAWLQIRGRDQRFSSGVESGEIRIRLPGYTLPENNEALYSKFPGLKKYRQTKTKYPRTKPEYEVEIHLKGHLEAEEILRMILEDGEEIPFENIEVPPEYSIDGKRHTIESFEDWNKWYAGDGTDTVHGWY